MSQGDLSSFFGNAPFDPNSVEPASDFDVIPAGDHPVIIESAQVKPTKAGNGHYFEFQLTILGGPCKGRKLWDRLNIDNPNPVAVDIAKRSLSALTKSTIGNTPLSNLNQLLRKTCVACVKIKEGENSIRTYKPFADAASVQQQQYNPAQGVNANPPPIQPAPPAVSQPIQQQQVQPQPQQQQAPPQQQYVQQQPQQQQAPPQQQPQQQAPWAQQQGQ